MARHCLLIAVCLRLCRNSLRTSQRANVMMVSELKGTAPRDDGEQKCSEDARG
jgi:hypothetical protein